MQLYTKCGDNAILTLLPANIAVEVILRNRHVVQMRNIASLYQLAHTSVCLHYFYRKAPDNIERKVVLLPAISSVLYMLVR